MAIEYSGKLKRCAVCAYWGGVRKIDSFNEKTICNGGVAGVCANPKSSFKNKQVKADYGGCFKFEKWQALK